MNRNASGLRKGVPSARSPRDRFGFFAWVWLTVAAVATMVSSPSQGEEEKARTNVALKAASALYEGIRHETLPNGLQVYLKPISGAELVTTMVAYRVGSCDEDLDATGLSHYLEHLMFKGTDKILPGDIDRQTLRNGGANNAYTSEDMTVYHFDFAADRFEVALEIEADRMRNIRIDEKHEFEQEKGAVIEELQKDEDEPWELEQKAILPLLFDKKAPYGHPVIGERDHVRGAKAEVIKSYYDRWYHPNNASLVIVGGFDPDKTLAKVKALFGSIPKAELPRRKENVANSRKAPHKLDMESKFESPRLLMGFNGVKVNDPDSFALDVVDALLSSGKTSRLYKKFIEGEEIASSAGSGNSTGRYPGWFAFQIELLKGKDLAHAEKVLLAEIQKLRDERVSDAEVNRVKQKLIANTIFARESVHGLADSVARGVSVGDLESVKTYLPRILAVTPADVQRVAKKYLDPETRVVIYSSPKKSAKEAEKSTSLTPRASLSLAAAAKPHGTVLKRSPRDEVSAIKARSLKDAWRVELPNGLVLLLLEDHRLPIVVAQAGLRHVNALEPAEKSGLAALVGGLLDEGAGQRSGPEIADLIENVGGKLDLSSGGGAVHVLASDRSLALGLLFDCLSKPTFPAEAFAREKAQQLSLIEDRDQRPDARAHMAYEQLCYGDHFLGRPSLGRLNTVEPLTRDDCLAFHKKAFVPNNTILVVVGDFSSKEIVEEITKLTADWQKAEVAPPKPPEVMKPKELTEKIISMPEAAQLHLFLGHVGIRHKDPDYYKLLVMDYVLGTGPGFTDRLSSKIRDRAGLAYTINGSITSTAGEEPGLFTCYIGTTAKNFDLVKKMIVNEVKVIRDTKPTAKEVEDVKSYLLGNLPFQLSTSSRVASQLLAVERLGLGLDYFDKYREAVSKVTPVDVQAVAAKHLDPDHLVIVAAGPIAADGTVLDKAVAPAEKVAPKPKD